MKPILMFFLMLSVSACRGSFEIPPQPTIVEAPRETVTEQVEALCSVRAARFHGLVTVPCIEVARQIRP